MSAADQSLPGAVIEAAVDAVAPGGQALRQLADALAADPGALTAGAPPVAGRLAAELIARGSATLAIPACTVCGRAGKPLFRGDGGGVCQRCRAWQVARPCATCGKVKPAAGFDEHGRAVCEVCHRRDDPRRHRECAACGKTAPVAVRGRGRAGRHLHQLLPATRSHLQQMPAAATVHLRGDQPAGLPLVLATGHRRLRALRARPAAASPLAGRTGLRPVLPGCPAPPGAVRTVRAAAAAGRPARPRR